MKKIILIISIAILLKSCCGECPLEPVDEVTIECKIRDATITQFNPNLVLSGTELVPVPEYSIQAFQFPFDDSNSGLLTNDERFEEQDEIIIASAPIGNTGFRAAILDDLPLNSDIKGDLMVVDVDTTVPDALIRVKGSVQKLSLNFFSENATEFCEFLKANEYAIEDAQDNLEQYGRGIPGSEPAAAYNAADIDVVNAEGIVVTGNPDAPQPSRADIQNVIEQTAQQAVNIRVQPGDVFVYRAVNGRTFVFVIADINSGNQEPYKRRITILFNTVI